MSSIAKKWAAVKGDEIVEEAWTKEGVCEALRKRGEMPDDYDIVAIPQSGGTIFL